MSNKPHNTDFLGRIMFGFLVIRNDQRGLCLVCMFMKTSVSVFLVVCYLSSVRLLFFFACRLIFVCIS